MLLGKRPRPYIRRTTSMSGITTVDDLNQKNNNNNQQEEGSVNYYNNSENMNGFDKNDDSNYGLYEYDQRFLAATMLSPRNLPTRSNSGDFLETPHFLRTCGLCHRRLATGKDIYMYRGDTAFCSQECREKQMKHDERKEKCSSVIMGSKNEDRHASPSKSSSSSSSSTRKSETLAAA